jgi:hypothetical protein
MARPRPQLLCSSFLLSRSLHWCAHALPALTSLPSSPTLSSVPSHGRPCPCLLSVFSLPRPQPVPSPMVAAFSPSRAPALVAADSISLLSHGRRSRHKPDLPRPCADLPACSPAEPQPRWPSLPRLSVAPSSLRARPAPSSNARPAMAPQLAASLFFLPSALCSHATRPCPISLCVVVSSACRLQAPAQARPCCAPFFLPPDGAPARSSLVPSSSPATTRSLFVTAAVLPCARAPARRVSGLLHDWSRPALASAQLGLLPRASLSARSRIARGAFQRWPQLSRISLCCAHRRFVRARPVSLCRA